MNDNKTNNAKHLKFKSWILEEKKYDRIFKEDFEVSDRKCVSRVSHSNLL